MSNNKIALYPGSFFPFTKGHLNVLYKAEAIFGEGNVWVAIGTNPDKSDQSRAAELNTRGQLSGKKVVRYTEFLTDYIFELEKEGYDVTIVRGLRNGADLDYEVNQLRFMQEMKPNVKICFIPCDKEFEHVSSSAYRALEKIRPGAGHKYLAQL